jgi:rubrerythrin
MQEAGSPRAAPDEFVEFWTAGVGAKGEFHCSDCSYSMTVHAALPVCPICGGDTWEQSDWHPFRAAYEQQRL